MPEASEITTVTFAWLNQVKRDPTLPASGFKVAFQLGQKTNTDHFVKTGELLTWQSHQTIASAIVMSERTVREMLRRLESAGHLLVEVGHGPGNSSRYLLVQMRQSAAGFMQSSGASNTADDCRIEEQNRQSTAGLIRQSDVANTAVQRTKYGSLLPPNDLSNNSLNKSAPEPSLPAWARSIGGGKYFVLVDSEGGDLIARYCEANKLMFPMVSPRENAFIVPYVWPPGTSPTEINSPITDGAAA